MKENKEAKTGLTTGKEEEQRRQEHKRQGRKTLKRHYWPLILLFVIMVFFGTEYTELSESINNLRPGTTLSDTFDVNAIDEAVADVDAIISETTDTADVPGIQMDTEKVKSMVLTGFRMDTRDWLTSRINQYLRDKEADIEKNESSEHQVLGIDYSKGMLAQVVDMVSSGRLDMIVIKSVSTMTKSENIGVVVQVILSMGVQFVMWVFVFNVLAAAARRLFLMSRTYDKVRLMSITDFATSNGWRKASLTMLLKWVFHTLWSITVIGGVIKRYSYYMVPYIVAENPKIKPLDAITLSRKMMDGHKLQCFVYEVSFLPWYLLGMLTIGLSEIFYSMPYKICTMSEYYVYLRSLAKENNIPNADQLNDEFLFRKASREELETVYSDVEEENAFIAEHEVTLQGARAFLVKNFGIWVGPYEERQDYHEVEARKHRVTVANMALAGAIYPQRLNPGYERHPRRMRLSESANYLKANSVGTIILLFFAFSLVGWMWEVSLHIIMEGTLVNRGMMRGPWLPIYGFGGVLMLLLLKRFRDRPLLEIFLMVVVSGALEYTTSWIIEMAMGIKYWDYSGYYLNLNGRICAEGLIVFTLAGILVVYILAPTLDGLFMRIPQKAMRWLCSVLVFALAADFAYASINPNTGEGITDYDTNAIVPDSDFWPEAIPIGGPGPTSV